MRGTKQQEHSGMLACPAGAAQDDKEDALRDVREEQSLWIKAISTRDGIINDQTQVHRKGTV